MNEIELTELQQCEIVIEKGLNTFMHVGSALLSIRDKKLYRSEYSTFENYCKERWGFERRQAYRLMDAAGVVQNVSNWPHFGQCEKYIFTFHIGQNVIDANDIIFLYVQKNQHSTT